MKYHRPLTIHLSFLLLAFSVQEALAQAAQQRDLTRYDDGSSFDFNCNVGQAVIRLTAEGEQDGKPLGVLRENEDNWT
jgi:hypothetical protein